MLVQSICQSSAGSQSHTNSDVFVCHVVWTSGEEPKNKGLSQRPPPKSLLIKVAEKIRYWDLDWLLLESLCLTLFPSNRHHRSLISRLP